MFARARARAENNYTTAYEWGDGDPTALVNSSIAREKGSDSVSPEFGSDTDTDLIGHNPIRYGWYLFRFVKPAFGTR